jgi:hypothetical protein
VGAHGNGAHGSSRSSKSSSRVKFKAMVKVKKRSMLRFGSRDWVMRGSGLLRKSSVVTPQAKEVAETSRLDESVVLEDLSQVSDMVVWGVVSQVMWLPVTITEMCIRGLGRRKRIVVSGWVIRVQWMRGES